MNDINELIEIILSLGGSASSSAIVQAYCKAHHMVVQKHFTNVVETVLKSNKNQVRLNRASNIWEVNQNNSETLTVSDNKYFKTISEVMLQVFHKAVPLSQGYFKVDEEHMVWFPQPNNDKWENTLSSDGFTWREKPKTSDITPTPDSRPRYVFIHEADGYRFTGLFMFAGASEERALDYKLIDDKVQIIKPRPYLVICRVAYMKYYDGITKDDIPVNGGSYVNATNDAYEKFNFHQYEDGNCYVFIETKYRSGHSADDKYARSINIEQIDPVYKGKDHIDGVRVVLMAFSPTLKKNVVVGWYDDATVFRNRVIEDDRIYMIKCRYVDAHLIPDDDRTFEIPRARGNSFGIGQNNFWYIQKVEAARDLENELTEYIESRE